ncbi:MAG: lipopolysaccharide transport periplasmic protein LptA [Rhodocyclaceae bacterium]|nr:MAG: lipopolysaccharide transport periplasmic protein LptA [Rhodocyclaceae bacterium]
MKLKLFCVVILALSAPPALAERADRDKPLLLDAGLLTVDDAKKIRIFTGDVRISQGSLIILCEKLVVSDDPDGVQSGVATGGPGGLARFRQKREGRDEYIEGEAERIVYDGKAEKTEFFQRARIKSGRDEVSGQYISYDAKSENYVVSSGPNGAGAPSSSDQNSRVRAVIQPRKGVDPVAPAKPAVEALPLKPAAQILTPLQE